MNSLDLTNLSIEHNKLLNDISLEIKTDYHVLINQLYSESDNNIYWYVNSLLSRNNFVSEVFINLCYLELVKKIFDDYSITEVIVYNNAQKNVLYNYYNNNEIKVRVDFNLKRKVKNYLTPFYMFYLNLTFFISSVIARSKERRQFFLKNISELTIIDTFVTPFEFNSGTYKSRHYPKDQLWDYLSPIEKKSIYFVPEFVSISNNISSVIRKLELADENFIFKNDFLQISDYCRALFGPLLIKKIDFSSYSFRGFKIAPILKKDFFLNITNINSFKGILNFYFFRRAKKYNIDFKLIVNWFENQSFDRGFNLGARKFYSQTNLIGFQPFVQDLNFQFHLCPIEIEEFHLVIPKSIIVIGEKHKKQINRFYTSLNVDVGPSIRFKYLNNCIEYTSLKTEFILVALPISIEESFNLLNVLDNLRISFDTFFNSMTWVLKPHPDLDLFSIKREFNALFDVIVIENQPIGSLLNNSSVVITNGSTVAIESVVFGKPVCIIGAQNGLTQNPIPQDIDPIIWEICYDANELFVFLKRISLFNEKDYLKLFEIGNKLKSEYFEPVNLNSIKKLLLL